MEHLLKEKGVEAGGFAQDVLRGLSSSPKKIASKYLYDDKGSKLFEEIMNLPEYYPTKCEFEILKKYKNQILEHCSSGAPVEIVDLGAGNGLKAMVLIKLFLKRVPFKYIPVDISRSAIEELENSVRLIFPSLDVEGLPAEYSEGLKILRNTGKAKKLILLLGSNIGNFNFKEALVFLKNVRESLNPEDLLLIGFDLKKDPSVIRSAYDDSKGVTSEFNLNILKRINTELGARFDLQKFMFYPSYDPHTGEVKSFIISKERQELYIEAINKSFVFEKWESIHTECSNKFDLPLIEKLASHAGFIIKENFLDSREYFMDSLWGLE